MMDLTQPIVAAIAALIVLFAPLIPAIIMFLIFPDNKLGMSGLLAKVSVRSTGAVGLYLVLFLLTGEIFLGYSYWNAKEQATKQVNDFKQRMDLTKTEWENQKTEFEQKLKVNEVNFQHLQQRHRPVWTIVGSIELYDEYNNPIIRRQFKSGKQLNLIDKVQWKTEPPEFTHAGGNMTLRIPEDDTGSLRIMFEIEGFGETTLTVRPDQKQAILGQFEAAKNLNHHIINENVIQLDEPIKIRSNGPYQIADHRSGDETENRAVTEHSIRKK